MCQKIEVFKSEIHEAAIFEGCKAIHTLIQELPDGPLTEEITNLVETQLDIFHEKLRGHHFGTKHLMSFLDICNGISECYNQKEEQQAVI